MERRKICRYFEKGSCKKDNCPFIHLKENRKTCSFYLEGYCKRGEACNFYHPPKQQQKIANLKEELKKKVLNQKKEQNSEDEHEQNNEIKHQKIQQHQIHEEEQHHQSQKIQQKEEIEELNDKMQKINFLLGINHQNQSESDQEIKCQLKEEKPMQAKQQRTVQFVKIFPKKFIDYSKTPEFKAKVLEQEKRLFKGVTYIQTIKTLTDPIQKEYYQIIRKFQDSFTLKEQEEPKVYLIKIRPLLFQKQINLRFQFLEDTVDIQVNAKQYPGKRAVFTILNNSIPKQYKNKFIDQLDRYHVKKNIFDTLKIVQNGFEKMYAEAEFKLESEYFSQKQIQRRLQSNLNKKEQSLSIHPKQEKKRIKREKDRNKYVSEIKYRQNEKIQNIHYGYQLTIESLVIQNCQYAVIEKALLYLECVCEKQFFYVLEAGSQRDLKIGVKLQCKKCQILIMVALQREVAQAKSHSLGKIGVNNGKLVDIGGLGFKIGCNCDKEITFEKLQLPGERAVINCHTCFQMMNVIYMGLKFFNHTIKQSQVEPNRELPNKGTCKHMKLSFRWLRYGCCGRTFSCDDCHIVGSVELHEKVKGLTMLCGFCSREQPVSDNCSHCHKQLVKGVDKGGHWEGGFGCRDQTLLSRKDAKKYTGLTKKK